MTKFMHMILGLVAASVAVPAWADMVNMTAALAPGNEVPPVQSSGSGAATIRLDTASHQMSWEVQVQNLTAPMTAAHFHGPATSAQNGPVVIPIAKAGDQSPFKGSVTLTPDQMTDVLNGHYYVNVHTPTYPPGELRGQVVKQ